MNTAVVITAIIAAFILGCVIVTATRDVAQAKHQTRAKEDDATKYPFPDGDFTVLGPEVFVGRTGDVICWKGVNYERQTQEGRPA